VLCLYAERITAHTGAAEDIVVESLEKAFRQRQEFQLLDNLKRYVYRLVRNAAINYSIQVKNRTAIHGKINQDQDLLQGTETESPFDLEMLRVELLDEIYREVENLPGQCRIIFKMIFFENLGTERIAEQLNLNSQTIRSQKARAIRLLKTRLLKTGKIASLTLVICWFLTQ